METALKYFEFFSYPTFFIWKSDKRRLSPTSTPRRVASVTWCVLAFLLFVYHNSHLYWYLAVQNFFNTSDTSAMLFRLLYTTSMLWTFYVKAYLLWCCCCKMNGSNPCSPLASYVSQFNDASQQILTSIETEGAEKSHRWKVWIILTLRLFSTVGLVATHHTAISRCLAQDCGYLYVTPLIDPINNAIGIVTESAGVAILPILISIACMQFTNISTLLTAHLQTNQMSVDIHLMRQIVTLFEVQATLVRRMQGCLVFLISFFAVSMIAIIAFIATQAKDMDWYSVIWVASIFAYITLVGFTSSRAQEAVRS